MTAIRTETLAEGISLYPGDCLDVLAAMEPNSIDSCVTDPPYHLTNNTGTRSPLPGQYTPIGKPKEPRGGFMGKAWDGGDIAFRPEIWAQVLRVLKPGAHLLSFGGTRTYHRMACAIEDAGFEIRDSIQWLYGSGFPKSLDVSKGIDRAAGAERRSNGDGSRVTLNAMGDGLKNRCMDCGKPFFSGNPCQCPKPEAITDAARQWEGWGTALKPACEPIVLARKPLSESTVAANVLKWGTGALNIDACRVAAGGHAHDAGRDSREDSTPYIFPSPTDDQTSCSSRTLFPVSSASQHPQRSDLLSNVELSDRENSQSQDFPADCRPSDDSCDALIREGEADGQASAGRPGDVDKSRDPQSARERSPDCLSMPSNDDTTRHIQQQGNGRDSEPSANRRYTDNGSTNFAATPGPRGGSPAGRWPANVIHDGSDEVVGAFPETASGLFKGNRSADKFRATYGAFKGTPEGETETYGDSGSAARFFYTAKADSDDRLGSKHPTVKPVDLIQYLVRLVTPPHGLVLDCFAGTGTTGEACIREKLRCILIEREAEYCDDIRRRMRLAMAGPLERTLEAHKARNRDKPVDHGPLFGVPT